MDRSSWWSKATGFLRGGSAATNSAAKDHATNHSTRRGPRLVIDTNIFIAAVRAPNSSSRRLLDSVADGRATLLVSRSVFVEYQRILSKAVGGGEREQLIRRWIAAAETIDASRGPRIVPDDPDDDKFVELALVGEADAIVSNDSHLLEIAHQSKIPILRPGDALRELV